MPEAKKKDWTPRKGRGELSKEHLKKVADSDSLRASNPFRSVGAKRQQEALTEKPSSIDVAQEEVESNVD